MSHFPRFSYIRARFSKLILPHLPIHQLCWFVHIQTYYYKILFFPVQNFVDKKHVFLNIFVAEHCCCCRRHIIAKLYSRVEGQRHRERERRKRVKTKSSYEKGSQDGHKVFTIIHKMNTKWNKKRSTSYARKSCIFFNGLSVFFLMVIYCHQDFFFFALYL